MIKNIKIVYAENSNSKRVLKLVTELCSKHGLIINSNTYDLVIAIGGDGTFIRALRETDFCKSCLYVGINTGHLGFLQEVEEKNIEQLFELIKYDNFKIESLSIEKIEVINKLETLSFHSLNEMVIRDMDLKRLNMSIKINNKHLEHFAGDGLIISTPTGSTAYNFSTGGSIIYPTLNTLQITPLAPIMSEVYKSLRNSIIVPENMTISIFPEKMYSDRIKLIIDGESINFSNVEQINITTDSRGVNVLRFNDYDFWTRINEKFLK